MMAHRVNLRGTYDYYKNAFSNVFFRRRDGYGILLPSEWRSGFINNF